jgi:EpsI family protein
MKNMAEIYGRSVAGLKDMAGSLSRTGLMAWLKALVYAALLGALYFGALHWLVTMDWPRDDYSHCYIVPFLLLYLLWEKRQTIMAAPARRSWTGLLPLCLALALFWIGELAGELFSMYISFWLAIVGLLWLHLGWPRLKRLAFPLVMILTMFPLPYFLDTKVLNTLKLISSKLGVAVLQLYGMPVFREGNVIDLGFTQLQVVDACSGLRYVMPLLVLSLLLAYWFKASFWKRAMLVISSVPLAIAVNGLRIALTGILYSVWGAAVAEEFFHGFSSWLIFLCMIPFLLLEMWILRKLPPRGPIRGLMDDGRSLRSDDGRKGSEGTRGYGESDGRGEVPEGGKSAFGSEEESVKANLTKGTRDDVKSEGSGKREDGSMTDREKSEDRLRLASLLQPVFVVAVLLLAATLALSHAIEFREKIPVAKSLRQFPTELAQWSGVFSPMEQQFIKELDLSDYTIINYRDSSAKDVNFYVAYYESQRKGESIHSPETCLPGSGWEFQQAGRGLVPLSNGETMRVNRAYMEKSGSRQLAYYWFPQRGRTLTTAYELKVYTFWDSLTKHRTDGALVRVITPVYASETLNDAEARLQGFTREVVPVLDQFIPK